MTDLLNHKAILAELNLRGYTSSDIAREIGISGASVLRWKQSDTIPEKRVESLKSLLDKVQEAANTILSRQTKTPEVIEKKSLKDYTIEELTKELASRSFRVKLDWMGGF